MEQATTRDEKRAATARRILAAAQHEFGEHGFASTTVRAIARRAGIDPSLVIQHYGSKEQLFAIAIELPDETPDSEVVAHVADVVKLRLGPLPPETRALVRSMLTTPAATAETKRFLDERVANLTRAIGGEDAELRSAVIVSAILGITVARHFLELDVFAGISDERLATGAAEWLTAGLDGDGSS